MADYRLIHGDALDVLRGMADNSVDAIVCDPPAGINFMGAKFDHDRGGRTQWVAWLAAIMAEAKRVIKPGGHALVWALPRTSHWTACALEDAGWEVRDRLTHFYSDGGATAQAFMDSLTDEQRELLARAIPDDSGVYHLFGQGFPKSTDISKQLDKRAGAEREVVGVSPKTYADNPASGSPNGGNSDGMFMQGSNAIPITTPATDAAKQWDGWGSALKPSVENWILVRKPLSEPSIAANVLAMGTGAINIDASRITTRDNLNGGTYSPGGKAGPMPGDTRTGAALGMFQPGSKPKSEYVQPTGRFPSHLLLSHHPACVRRGEKRVKGTNPTGRPSVGSPANNSEGWNGFNRSGVSHADADGRELVADYICADNCPIRLLDEQAGVRKSAGSPSKTTRKWNKDEALFGLGQASTWYGNQSGTNASRFFTVFEPDPDALFVYAPKASRSDRSSNGAVNNTHPTAKSTQLGRWLSRLICPVGGTILDPFAGSGSLGVSAILEGFNWIGIDESAEYIAIARARLEWAANQRPKAEQLTLTV